MMLDDVGFRWMLLDDVGFRWMLLDAAACRMDNGHKSATGYPTHPCHVLPTLEALSVFLCSRSRSRRIFSAASTVCRCCAFRTSSSPLSFSLSSFCRFRSSSYDGNHNYWMSLDVIGCHWMSLDVFGCHWMPLARHWMPLDVIATLIL